MHRKELIVVAVVVVTAAAVSYAVATCATLEAKERISEVETDMLVYRTAVEVNLALAERVLNALEDRQQIMEQIIIHSDDAQTTLRQLTAFNRKVVLDRNEPREGVGGAL